MYTYIKRNGTEGIDKQKAFYNLLNGKLPSSTKQFKQIIADMDNEINSKHKNINSNSLNNCHGDWYEWLLGFGAWNYYIENKSMIVVPLPNSKSFDVADLYIDELRELIIDLREKVNEATQVELITSNPDFVIINTSELELNLPFTSIISSFTTDNISELNSMYREFIGKCGFESIIGYLSAKFSLRPDRRLQIPHEGSLLKAIYTHLQTRKWILKPVGLKYYAVTTSFKDADKKALRTVATHTITSVQTLPIPAVDKLYEVNTISGANIMYNEIL